MLGLGYPGGPIIEKLARDGDPSAHRFTLPRFKDGANDFSFSGLKTAVLTKLKQRENAQTLPEGQERADLLASFQYAVIAQLTDRLVRAAGEENASDVILAGGVACNGALRIHLRERLEAIGLSLYVARPRWCTDNAAMIAGAAFAQLSSMRELSTFDPNQPLEPIASWRLGT